MPHLQPMTLFFVLFFDSGGKASNLGLTQADCKEASRHATLSLEKNKEFYEQLGNTKLILGSLPLVGSSNSGTCTAINYNLAQIPISTMLFKGLVRTQSCRKRDRHLSIYPICKRYHERTRNLFSQRTVWRNRKS